MIKFGMDKNNLERLENELKKYKEKVSEMQKNWSETRGGSRYGDEYLELQIKVYQSMIDELNGEILRLKKNKKDLT
jgi:prefoldin subunit 5